jgi:ubiquinone/menaquinone biosynthesis C-methylase UbiE
MKITPEAKKFILLQRTQLNKKATPEQIEADFRKDFDTYKDFLPENLGTVVDIGSGIGVQNILLREKFPDSYIQMIDKTREENEIWYGFKEKGAFYNSMTAAERLMKANDCAKNMNFQEVTPNNQICMKDNSVDLVTSFISWGFHYPVETYLDEVIRVMKPGASLIIDVRHNTDGHVKLSSVFESVRVIAGYKKYYRYLCKKVI